MVEGTGPDRMVAEGRPSIPGPTAVPMIRLTAPQKLLFLLFFPSPASAFPTSSGTGHGLMESCSSEMGIGESEMESLWAPQLGRWREGLEEKEEKGIWVMRLGHLESLGHCGMGTL